MINPSAAYTEKCCLQYIHYCNSFPPDEMKTLGVMRLYIPTFINMYIRGTTLSKLCYIHIVMYKEFPVLYISYRK